MKNIKIWDILVLFLIIAFSFFRITQISNPAIGDEASAIWPIQEMLKSNNFLSIEPYVGHPPFLSYLALVISKIFGLSMVMLHSTILLFSIASIIFLYLIIKQLSDKKYAFLGTLLLATNPLFFEFSGYFLPEIPLLFFALLSFYFYIKNQKIAFLIASCFLVLTKLPGIIFFSSILIYDYLKNERKNPYSYLKNHIIYLLPFLILLSWTAFTLLHYFSGVYKELWINFINNGMKFILFEYIFIAEGRFILTISLSYLFVKKKIEKVEWLLFLVLIINSAFYLISFLKRYMLISLSFLFILSLLSLSKSRQKDLKLFLIVIPVILIQSITIFNYFIPENLNEIEFNKLVISYINNNFQNDNIEISGYFMKYLNFEVLGYIKRPLNVTECFNYSLRKVDNLPDILIQSYQDDELLYERNKEILPKYYSLNRTFKKDNMWLEIWTKNKSV